MSNTEKNNESELRKQRHLMRHRRGPVDNAVSKIHAINMEPLATNNIRPMSFHSRQTHGKVDATSPSNPKLLLV
uniref:Uncharacterized protein n=1 Tax=uncultured alpha proteobacterium EF100_102A06 TaxID=710799 RepID=E0Y2B2_9PROT|nr:hypothetical protein [uncultured alpha proteobacterium EF100_102A06]